MKHAPLGKFLLSAQAGIACGARDDSGIAQLRLNNLLTNGEVDFNGHIRIPAELVPDDMLLRQGDVLFNNTNSVELVGKTVYFDGHKENVTFSNHVTRLRVKDGELSPEYLALWLQHQWRSKVFESLCDRWIGQAAVQRSKLEALEVPLPLLKEQHKIAARLKAQLAEVETARQAAQVQLSDTRLLRTRMLKAFFVEMDEAPKKKLGDYAHITSGVTPSRDNDSYWHPAEIAWVKTGEIDFSPITAVRESISRKALTECSLSLLPPKTVLIAITGEGKTRGRSALLDVSATTNQHSVAVLPNDTWEASFLQLWLQSSYHDLRELSEGRGGSRSALSGAQIKALEAPAPDRTEQQHIVARIQAAMTEIDAMENSSKAALEDINRLPNRVLAQAFETAI